MRSAGAPPSWISLVLAIVFLGLFACHSTSSEPPPAPAPTPPGACNNERVDGMCVFVGMTRVDPTPVPPGVPSPPAAPDASPDASGHATFEVTYQGPPPSNVAVYGRVSAAPSALPVLESFFKAHPQAHCGGEIVRAPCAPGSFVQVTLPTPPVGSVVSP